MDTETQQGLIAAIYDMAAGAASWPAVLRGLAGPLNCHFAACVATTRDRVRPRSLGVAGLGGLEHQRFLDEWHRTGLHGARRPAVPGSVVDARSIVPKPEFLRSAIYRGFFRERRMEEMLRLDLLDDGAQIQTVSLARPWAAGGYSATEVAFARSILPHLQRSTLLRGRLQQAELMTRAAFASLDAADRCALVLDRTGRILHATPAAAELLRQGDGLVASGGGVRAAAASDAGRLAALIAAACGRPPVSGTLRVFRRSLRPALALIAMPLPAASEAAPEGGVLLQVTDPDADIQPSPAMLAELFRLTGAEAAVALQLLRGLTAGEIAAQTGRGLPTIRSHIAGLMAKTGMRRQADLMRLLARLPATGPE